MSRQAALEKVASEKIYHDEHIDMLLDTFLERLDITKEMFERAVIQNHLAPKRYARVQMRLIFLLEGRTKLKPRL